MNDHVSAQAAHIAVRKGGIFRIIAQIAHIIAWHEVDRKWQKRTEILGNKE